MEIKQVAKNGTITQAIKNREELTSAELRKARLNFDDYDTFHCHYNKQGEVLRVAGGDLSEAFHTRQAEMNGRRTDMDFCLVTAGKEGPRQKELYSDSERRLIRQYMDAKRA